MTFGSSFHGVRNLEGSRNRDSIVFLPSLVLFCAPKWFVISRFLQSRVATHRKKNP